MTPKTKIVTEQIMEAIMDSNKVWNIDSTDYHPTMISDDQYQFEADQWHEDQLNNKPLGKFIYTITVKGSYIPFDEED
jgi:hypothetical protein